MYTKRSNVLAQLRGDMGDLARFMRPGNSFVDIKMVDFQGLLIDQLNGNDIEIKNMDVVYLGQTKPVSVTFIRATYGHKRDVLAKMVYGTYVPYKGSNDIFCITHTSDFGLGEISHGRTMNMLSTPDITENKGVMAYVSISMARARGCEFWSRVGDRYGNKVACFDTDLKASFYNLKYTDTFGTDENLLRTHASAMTSYGRFMSPAKAFAQIKRLFIEISDEEDDADDEREEPTPLDGKNQVEIAEMLEVLVL